MEDKIIVFLEWVLKIIAVIFGVTAVTILFVFVYLFWYALLTGNVSF